MKNLLLTYLFISMISFVAKGQLSPGSGPLGFTFYKPQPQLSILKGVSSPASHPDFDWFEPEPLLLRLSPSLSTHLTGFFP